MVSTLFDGHCQCHCGHIIIIACNACTISLEVTSLKMMLQNERREKADLRLEADARQRVQNVEDQTLGQLVPQHRPVGL